MSIAEIIDFAVETDYAGESQVALFREDGVDGWSVEIDLGKDSPYVKGVQSMTRHFAYEPTMRDISMEIFDFYYQIGSWEKR